MNSTKSKLISAAATFLFSLFIFNIWPATEIKLSLKKNPESPSGQAAAEREKPENIRNYEKVICTCEGGSTRSAAVEIAEVKNLKGELLGVTAHVYQPEEAHLMIEGAVPKWDYLAVSAHSGTENIKIIHQPRKQSGGYDWVLVLKGERINLKQRVKNCTAVSDE
jgi:hypothetical protein